LEHTEKLKTMWSLDNLRLIYSRMGYHFTGIQAVVKPCHWLKESLLSGGLKFCYKQLWYGIPSHRCLQMSPVIVCNYQCLYCWRVHEADLKIPPLTPDKYSYLPYDPPERIVEGSLEAWRNILSGFKGNPLVDEELLREAFKPIHVTLSLTGEPTLYPFINEIIKEYFQRGFKSVFLVTNGSRPEVLRNLKPLPSQLYVTLPAPDKRTFTMVTRPLQGGSWNRILETLRLLKEIKCPTVVRLTMVKGLNMISPEGYARLIRKAEPTYVEVKAAMSVGYFRRRLSRESMPRHSDIVKFAQKLASYLREDGYKIIGEYLPSRVVLISKIPEPLKIIE